MPTDVQWMDNTTIHKYGTYKEWLTQNEYRMDGIRILWVLPNHKSKFEDLAHRSIFLKSDLFFQLHFILG